MPLHGHLFTIGTVQEPPVQVTPDSIAHRAQVAPPRPQARSEVPVAHVPPEQHPPLHSESPAAPHAVPHVWVAPLQA